MISHTSQISHFKEETESLGCFYEKIKSWNSSVEPWKPETEELSRVPKKPVRFIARLSKGLQWEVCSSHLEFVFLQIKKESTISINITLWLHARTFPQRQTLLLSHSRRRRFRPCNYPQWVGNWAANEHRPSSRKNSQGDCGAQDMEAFLAMELIIWIRHGAFSLPGGLLIKLRINLKGYWLKLLTRWHTIKNGRTSAGTMFRSQLASWPNSQVRR